MTHWLEDLTKTMADDKLPRRQAMRRIAGSVTGVALASLLPGQVLAKTNHLKKTCSTPCGCSICDFNNCNVNNNCYCFFELSGKGGCGCNSFCSQSPTCSCTSKCPKGSFCAVETGCNCGTSSGVCIPYCVGKNKHCQLGSGHGLTVTGRVV